MTIACRLERLQESADYDSARVVGKVAAFYAEAAATSAAAGVEGVTDDSRAGGSDAGGAAGLGGSSGNAAAAGRPAGTGAGGCAYTAGSGGAPEAIMALPSVVLKALAAAIDYLKTFGLEGVLAVAGAFRPLEAAAQMTLSANALRQLDILTAGEEGTKLVSMMANCCAVLFILDS